jgi:hypothetical protein
MTVKAAQCNVSEGLMFALAKNCPKMNSLWRGQTGIESPNTTQRKKILNHYPGELCPQFRL